LRLVPDASATTSPSDSPNDIVFDYTAEDVRRSIQDSLQRFGVDSYLHPRSSSSASSSAAA
jgi:hypothetical protein